ncbi:MAG: hypothetical protein ACOYXT_23875 [Bacteroidota bacterium]
METPSKSQSLKAKSHYFPIPVLVAVAACIGCGYLFLFVYERSMFVNSDRFLLTVLAMAISLPPLVVNTIGVLPKTSEGMAIPDWAYQRAVSAYMFSGSVVVCCLYGITILVGYFFGISTKVGVLTFLAMEILFAFIWRWANKKIV